MTGQPWQMLVASAGGHLTQLLRLRERLGLSPDRCLWVTYDTPQARELAATEPVIFGHGPSTRSVRAAVGNHRLAKDVVAPAHIERMVSTGAGIAVPLLLRAARCNIPAEYVESATRVDGPSLSGRILERVDGVRCASQWPWTRSGWESAPCVFDAFTAHTAPAPLHRPRQVLVTLGTHPRYRFDRLVAAVQRVLAPSDEVVWQTGATPPPGDARRVLSRVAPAEFHRRVAASDVVIGHAGIGTALTALMNGKWPILVPRQAAYHEHVDDHQSVVAGELQRRGLVLSREAGDLSPSDLTVAATQRVVDEQVAPAGAGDGASP